MEGETGAVLEPYLTTGNRGPLYREPNDLQARVKRYYDMGMQLHFHTMGDRAVREAMNAIEFARANGNRELKNMRHTVSHLGLVDPADMPRLYRECWERTLTETLAVGGTVSHHHGIGRVRREALARELGPQGVSVLKGLKRLLDPRGILNPGVLIPD